MNIDAIALTTYGKTANKDADENQNLDFQFGYLTGFESETENGLFDIADEAEARKISEVDESFREWKRGYWAGRMNKVFDKKKEE